MDKDVRNNTPTTTDQENPKLQIVKEVPRHPFAQLNGPLIFNPRKIAKESSPKSVHKPMETKSSVNEIGTYILLRKKVQSHNFTLSSLRRKYCNTIDP